MFRALSAHLQEDTVVYKQRMVSSISIRVLVVCRYTAWVRTDCRGKVVGRASWLEWELTVGGRLLVGRLNTLWTDDADLRLYITTVQDGWRKSAFLTRAWFPRTIDLITQYMEHFSEWSCWRMFIETRVFGEYFLKISVHKNSEFVINI